MNLPRAAVSGVVAGLLLVASPALADWEADVQFRSPGAAALGGSVTPMGRAHGSKAGMRMDFETAQGRISHLLDWKNRKAVTLLHATKSAMMMDVDRAGASVPDCDGVKDVEQCLKARGYQQTGVEEANGHPCTVYERKATKKDDPENVKLWRPKDLPEVPFLRTQTFDAKGKLLSQVNLTNVKVAPQPASLFTVPSDYRRMEEGRLASDGKGRGGLGTGNGSGTGEALVEQLLKNQQRRREAQKAAKETQGK